MHIVTAVSQVSVEEVEVVVVVSSAEGSREGQP